MNQYGLIGFPLSHSFSKQYFDNKFEQEHINNASFHLWELEQISNLPTLLKNNEPILGLAVTIPYKKKVIAYLDYLDPSVQLIGACNCIKIENNKLFGFNTDIIGFKISFEKLLQSNHKKALILGSGGASASVEYVLNQMEMEYMVVSRLRKSTANSLDYKSITKEIIAEYPIIINCTPLGTYPNIDTLPLIPYEFITDKNYLYDLVYNPTETLFLKKGKEKGATFKSGYEMLAIQAEENWKIWNK